MIRCLEVIGEAARNIPISIRQEYPQIDWNEITSMRHRLAHDYLGVSLKIVWDTAKENLPGLQEQIEGILREE